MDVVRDTIYIEDNPTSGSWDIVFDCGEYKNASQQSITPTIVVNIYSDRYFGSSESASSYTDTWLTSGTHITDVFNDATIWCIKVPSDLTFNVSGEGNSCFDVFLYLSVCVYDSSTFNASDISNCAILKVFEFVLRRMPVVSSGGSSSISVPTAPEIAQAVWNYYVASPSSGVVGTRTLSSVSDIAQAVWNYSVAEPASGVVGTRTLSTTVEVNPSAIAEAVWNYAVAEPASGTLGTRTLTTAIPTAANIATAVLTTDVSDEPVETDEYTLKHLVMASQRSKVVTENGETVWKIMGNRLSGETGEEIVIATRTLTLNTNGAIIQTM